MELNQESRSFCTPYIVLDTVAEQLADVDLTLPDYCPDIEKILKCTLTPKIQSKSLTGGQLCVEGICVVSVMYIESMKKSIRCCEQNVNFSQCFSVKETPDNPVILTKTKSEYINCRALSPRRLVMHGAFSLYAKVLSTKMTNIFAPKDLRLETYKKTVRCADLKSLCQEQFTICEEISVADKPAIESVLHSDVSVSITDSKAVTGKIMLNGEINLRMFYLTDVESGETAKLDYILPFNQIIDCEGINENTINCLSCEVMSYDIRLKNDMLSEKPAVLLDAKLCVTEEGYIVTEESIVTDAYSVLCASQPKFEQMKLIEEVIPVSDVHMEKVSIKVDDGKISKILDIYTDYVTSEKTVVDDVLKIIGKINICMLALNEVNTPVFIERSFDYEHTPSMIGDCNNIELCTAKISSMSYRLADDSTVEIRCEIKINTGAKKDEVITAVSDVELFEDNPFTADDCALTLYFANSGESLWEIAKSHNTRLDLLLSENSVEKHILDFPQMLLIPGI